MFPIQAVPGKTFRGRYVAIRLFNPAVDDFPPPLADEINNFLEQGRIYFLDPFVSYG